ncbi:MAG: autotransporter-associated beta strand repeat-containing protein, partial [Planctomycetaceae bacterium]|nr:autotransporter-associated beta strand repeat-containing protein [Planctomycetaceae bacterium]
MTAGTLNVAGGATLTLSDTNNIGATNIAATGTVTASQSDSLGTGTVANAGTLNLNGAGTVSNVLSGAGDVNVNDDIVLTGNSTATGTLTVAAGKSLTIGSGTTGSYAGNIANGGTSVTFDRSNDLTYGGVLSGTGNVIQAGAGTLMLSGTNTYTGTTAVNAGKVVVNNISALGTGSVSVGASGATLDVNGNSVTNAITLNGGSLVNDNTTTSATLAGATLGANSKVGGSGDVTFNTAFTGTYALEKVGTGTTTLTADNTALTGTTISAGKLRLTGSGTAGNVTL